MKASRVAHPRDFQINIRLNATELQMLRELGVVLRMGDSGVIRAIIAKVHGSVEPAMVRAIKQRLANEKTKHEATRRKILGG